MMMVVVMMVVTEMVVVMVMMVVSHHPADHPAHPMVVMMVVVVLGELEIVPCRGIGAGLIDRQQQRSRVGDRLQQVGERIGPENV